MKVYVDNKDKMTSYQWGYDEESKRYFVKINFDVPSDTKVNVLSIAEHDKQVRKEVCERLDKIIEKYLCKKGRYRESLDISSIIKQVMKEDLGN